MKKSIFAAAAGLTLAAAFAAAGTAHAGVSPVLRYTNANTYSVAGYLHPVRELAVSHGFQTVRCDDFNIGVVRDRRLVALWWMDKKISEDEGTLAEIGRECGLVAA